MKIRSSVFTQCCCTKGVLRYPLPLLTVIKEPILGDLLGYCSQVQLQPFLQNTHNELINERYGCVLDTNYILWLISWESPVALGWLSEQLGDDVNIGSGEIWFHQAIREYLNQCWHCWPRSVNHDCTQRDSDLIVFPASVGGWPAGFHVHRRPPGQASCCWPQTGASHWAAALRCTRGTRPGPCLTTVTWPCHKNFSQWEHSFLWKLRCHWLKGLRLRKIAVVRRGPGELFSKPTLTHCPPARVTKKKPLKIHL